MPAHVMIRLCKCSVICTSVLLACWCSLCSSLPILPLAGPSEVACSWGSTVTVQSLAADPDCGPSITTWQVTLESGQNVLRSSEVYLGDLATTQGPLTLTVNKTAREFFVNSKKQLQRYEGILRRSGTYLVQMTINYASCPQQQAETRFTVSPCPAQAAEASYQLQDCDKVKEPGKRKLTLVLDAFDPDANYPVSWQWQLLPATGIVAAGGRINSALSQLLPASISLESAGFSVGDGASRAVPGAAPAATCQAKTSSAQEAASGPSSCTLLVGAGPGRLRPGSSYVPMFMLQNRMQQSNGPEWQELAPVNVPKCPPRITKASATLQGSCKQGAGGRWLQLTADAVDLEEGPSAQLQYYWYLLLARNRNVVLTDSTSGRKLSLRVGNGPRQVEPGRSYIVKIVVVTKSGKQVISTKQQVGRVLEVPFCK